MQASAYIFYMIHGSIVDDRPVVLLGVASLIQSLVLIFQCVKLDKHGAIRTTLFRCLRGNDTSLIARFEIGIIGTVEK